MVTKDRSAATATFRQAVNDAKGDCGVMLTQVYND